MQLKKQNKHLNKTTHNNINNNINNNNSYNNSGNNELDKKINDINFLENDNLFESNSINSKNELDSLFNINSVTDKFNIIIWYIFSVLNVLKIQLHPNKEH